MQVNQHFFLSIHLFHSQESENIKRDVKPPAKVVRACWNRPKPQQRASCSINTTSVHCGNSQRAESHIFETWIEPQASVFYMENRKRIAQLCDLDFAVEIKIRCLIRKSLLVIKMITLNVVLLHFAL